MKVNDFPKFMRTPQNHIASSKQNTKDIDGYYFEGNDGNQMAFWTCHSDRVSKEHRHNFDEYMVCVQGQYTAIVDGKETILNPGDELFIPKGTVQSGRCIAGTRTIHAFGGKRINNNPDTHEKSLFMSEGDSTGMKKRLSFNEDAANYDKWRPRYTKEVFEDIIRYSGLGADKQALEIGIGTGQATEPFLKTGCSVTAVELGKNLADYSKEKFKAYPNLAIENVPFEDFRGKDGYFDLVYSATAFHWIPENIGFKKAFRLLKSGGTLALWWNRPFPDRADDKLHQDIQKIYEKFRPDNAGKPIEDKTLWYKKIQKTILFYGFTELKFQLYHGMRTFDADEYVELLNTYSDHKSLASDEKQQFESEIKEAIRIHGNRLTVYDTIDLYLARKP